MGKAEARASSIASRAARSDAELEAAGAALAALPWPEIITADSATCYLAMAGEPPTRPLIDVLTARGIAVALPIMRKGRTLAWGWWGAELERNTYGVMEPPEYAAFSLSSVSAVILPALRAGRDGSRLGRGAGYYDRALAQVPRRADGGPTRIAIVFDDEIDDSVPHDALDAPVDIIASPRGGFHTVA